MKNEQRKKEDCELLDAFVSAIRVDDGVSTYEDTLQQFKKDNDLLPKNVSGWRITDSVGDEDWIAYRCFEKGVIFGINALGEWFNSTFTTSLFRDDEYLASPKETLKRLSEFAENVMGFKKGINVVSAYNGITYCINGDRFSLTESGFYLGGVCIMRDGKWAKILKDNSIQQEIERIQKELNELKARL